MKAILLDNVDIDTEGQPFENDGSGKIVMVRANNYDGCLIDIQVREKGSEAYFSSTEGWHTLVNGSFVADGEEKIDYIPAGVEIRAKLSLTTGLTDSVRVVLL